MTAALLPLLRILALAWAALLAPDGGGVPSLGSGMAAGCGPRTAVAGREQPGIPSSALPAKRLAAAILAARDGGDPADLPTLPPDLADPGSAMAEAVPTAGPSSRAPADLRARGPPGSTASPIIARA